MRFLQSTKKKLEKNKKWVVEFTGKFAAMFGFNNYDITIKEADSNDQHYATICVRENYQDIEITLYPEFWEEERSEQAKVLLHEFSHYLTWSLNRVGRQLQSGCLVTDQAYTEALEQSTSMVENVIHRLLLGEYKDEQKYYQHVRKT